MAVSGHKNEARIRSYSKTDICTKEKMSETLTSRCEVSEELSVMNLTYFYQTLTSDHAKIRKKIALHPVDLKLGNVIGKEISQSLADFYRAGLNT